MNKIKLLFFVAANMLFACNYHTTQESITSDNDTVQKNIFQDSIVQQQSQNVHFDTTMYLLCSIESDIEIDTISTQVYLKSDTIYIFYKWIKNNDTIWSENLKYFTEFEQEWITYSINHSLPNIYNISDFQDLWSICVDFGYNDLKHRGYAIDKEIYKQYLLNHKGCLIEWGHPESREGLFVWYEPLRIFVLFYQP
ncbi:MAG: hypothetical protein LBV75_06705 [Paludibacter sp.]|jgi:hypothetical protein|nr:hypothetical protein [Paludibacter sp.]